MRITLKTDGGQLILEFAYGLGIGPPPQKVSYIKL